MFRDLCVKQSYSKVLKGYYAVISMFEPSAAADTEHQVFNMHQILIPLGAPVFYSFVPRWKKLGLCSFQYQVLGSCGTQRRGVERTTGTLTDLNAV